MNYKNIPDGSTKVAYTELSDTAKEKALREFLTYSDELHSLEIQSAKKGGMHKKVNDRNHIRRLYNNVVTRRRWKSDRKHLEAVIVGNLCEFLTDGTYITYIK